MSHSWRIKEWFIRSNSMLGNLLNDINNVLVVYLMLFKFIALTIRPEEKIKVKLQMGNIASDFDVEIRCILNSI